MTLKDPKYDGKGGLWKHVKHPKIAAQGSIQIGGRIIHLTIWHNERDKPSPDYNITVNEQKTLHDDIVWFRALNARACSTGKAPTMTGPTPDEDIPF